MVGRRKTRIAWWVVSGLVLGIVAIIALAGAPTLDRFAGEKGIAPLVTKR